MMLIREQVTVEILLPKEKLVEDLVWPLDGCDAVVAS